MGVAVVLSAMKTIKSRIKESEDARVSTIAGAVEELILLLK